MPFIIAKCTMHIGKCAAILSSLWWVLSIDFHCKWHNVMYASERKKHSNKSWWHSKLRMAYNFSYYVWHIALRCTARCIRGVRFEKLLQSSKRMGLCDRSKMFAKQITISFECIRLQSAHHFAKWYFCNEIVRDLMYTEFLFFGSFKFEIDTIDYMCMANVWNDDRAREWRRSNLLLNFQ